MATKTRKPNNASKKNRARGEGSVRCTAGLGDGERCMAEMSAAWNRIPEYMRAVMDRMTWNIAWQSAWCVARQSPSAWLGRLGEIARKHCSTYPGISTADACEQLYAIECTMEGVSAANDDLHTLIAMLRERCGMTAVEVVEMWQQKRPNDPS